MGKKKTIKAPVETFEGIVAGVRFQDGVGHTDDENAVAYFERQGYGVNDAPKEPAGDPGREYPEGDPSDKWTVKQMLAFAKDNGIEIEASVTKKDDVWAALQPGGTPYKGVTTPEGQALVNDSTDPKDGEVKDQATLPVQ